MQLPFETLQGILAAGVLIIGALFIIWLNGYRWLSASILCVLVSTLVILPFWYSYGDLGISDWDYYFSMHTNLRQTIVEHGQFPLWNPYTCGGTSALGDPEFPVLSPLFLLELVFGTPEGLRLSLFASTIIGALGMLHLSRKIGIGVLGGLIASLPMSLGTVNLLEMVEGHPNILAAMYIPWVLYFWYSAYITSGKKLIISIFTIAILLALMFFQGGIYLLMYMTGTFIFLPFLVKYPKRAIVITCIAGVLATGLAAVKLVPVALWIQQFQDTTYASSAYTLANLDDILLGRILHGAEHVIPNQGSGWHEYGAYVGPVILVLAVLGILYQRKSRIVRGLVLAAVLATVISSLGPYLKPIFDELSFIPRSNISRLILFAVIPLSLLAGYGIDSLQKRGRIMSIFAFLLFALASIDILTLTYPLAAQAFVLPHTVQTIERAPHPIAYSPFEYKIRHNGVDYTRAYDATLQGYGNMTYCSVLGPEPSVELISDEEPKGILAVNNEDATVDLTQWSPNAVTAQVTITQKTSAILNANYAQGWYVNGNPAKEIKNRPAIELEPGNHTLTFSYIPPGLKAGVVITVLTILGMISLYWKRETLGDKYK